MVVKLVAMEIKLGRITKIGKEWKLMWGDGDDGGGWKGVMEIIGGGKGGNGDERKNEGWLINIEWDAGMEMKKEKKRRCRDEKGRNAHGSEGEA